MFNIETVIMLSAVTGAVGFILGYYAADRQQVALVKAFRTMLREHLIAEHELVENGQKLSKLKIGEKDV